MIQIGLGGATLKRKYGGEASYAKMGFQILDARWGFHAAPSAFYRSMLATDFAAYGLPS
jgi:hypothetical protein